MALEAEKFDPKAGHVIAAVELTNAHDPVDAISEKDIAGWTAKIEQPTFPIDVAKLTEEQRNKIAEDVRNFEKLNQMIADNNAVAEANEAIEKRRAQAVAAAGGSMQPPTDPANDNSEATSAERQALIDRVGLASVQHAVVARTPMDPNGIIDTDGRLTDRSDLINQLGVEAVKKELEPDTKTDTLKETISPTVHAEEQPTSDSETEKMRTIMETKFGTTSETEKSTEKTEEALKVTRTEDIGLRAVESALNNPSEQIPEAKLEIPKHEVSNIRGEERWKHDLFGRLGARFERMSIQIKNAPKWAGLETMRQYHLGNVAKAETTVSGAEQILKAAQEKLTKKDASIEVSKNKMSSGGLFDRLAAAKLARERDAVVAQVEKAEVALKATQTSLEYKKSKLASYSEKLEHNATAITAKVEQRLAGDRADYEALTSSQEGITQKLSKINQIIEAAQNDLLLLEVRLKNKPEAAEKAEIKNGIVEAKATLAELLTSQKNLATEKMRIQAMASRAQLFLSGWSDMRSETK